jgi:hypothetical protein
MCKQTLQMHIIPWVVSVIVGNECCGEPAADEKDYCEHGCHTEVTATQRQDVSRAAIAAEACVRHYCLVLT